MWLAIILTILIAGIIGAGVNGVLIGRVGLSFFVVTLGTLSIYEGIVNIWSNTQTTYISSPLLDGIGFGHAPRDRDADLDHDRRLPGRVRRPALDLLRPGHLRRRRQHRGGAALRNQRVPHADERRTGSSVSAPGSPA